jgi:cleavage stimulation factor subunit 3
MNHPCWAASSSIADVSATTHSFLLNFAYAEHQETLKNNAEVYAIYEKLLKLLQVELEAIEAREAQNAQNSQQSQGELASAEGTAVAGANGTEHMQGEGEFGSQQEGAANGVSSSAAGKDGKSAKSKELADRRQEYGLVYVMYIRFALRAEGVDASRAAFAKARKDRWTTWEVFEAAGKLFSSCT